MNAEIQQQLVTPKPGMDYAGGWLTANRSWGGGAVLTHAGSNTMWYCVAWVAPKKDFAVLAAANLGGDDASQACDEAAAALIQVHERRAQQRSSTHFTRPLVVAIPKTTLNRRRSNVCGWYENRLALAIV